MGEGIEEALARFQPRVFGLFSGGHDSLCSTHIASQMPGFKAVVHINTGIGIEETREFVRGVCRDRGWPLFEYRPDAKTYDELVMDKGFPCGPQSHNAMYYWLKQRQIRRLVREEKRHPKDKVGLVAGIRINESDRRMGSGISTPVRISGAQLWLNPILDWSPTDKNDYMEKHGLPRNPVVDLYHKSMECLCGAFARRSELADIELWHPETAQRIHDLENRAQEAGLADHKWALGAKAPDPYQDELPLCSDCVAA